MYNKDIKVMTVNELKTMGFYTYMRSQKEREEKSEYVILYTSDLDLPEKSDVFYGVIKEKVKEIGYPFITLIHASNGYIEFYDSSDIESYYDYNKDFEYVNDEIITKENDVKMSLVDFVEKFDSYYNEYKDKRFFDFVE